MSKMRKSSAKVTVLAVLMLLIIGTSSNAISTSSGQVAQIAAEEVLAAGDFETVLSLVDGTVDGNIVSFSVADLAVASVSNCSGSAEMQSFAADLVAEANAGAVDGFISFDVSTVDTSSFEGIVPVEFSLSFDSGRTTAQKKGNKVVPAIAKGTGSVATLKFSGTARVGKGFSKDNLAMAGALAPSSVKFGFSQDTSNTAIDPKFQGKFTAFAVPNVGLRGTDIQVPSWGKTPKAARKLERNEINLESGSVEVDAVTGTITSKHRIQITKKS